MRKVLLLISIVLYLPTVFATEVKESTKYSIAQIHEGSKHLAIKNVPALQDAVGKEFIAQNEKGDQCDIPVVAIKEGYLIGSTQNCKISKELKVGQPLELSLFTGLTPKVEVAKEVVKKEVSQDLVLETAQNQNESWYIKFNHGFGAVKYPSYIQSTLDELKRDGATDHVVFDLDIGFYWPVAQTMAFGFTFGLVTDSYTYNGTDLSINQYQVGPSLLYYFGSAIGRGLFLRADGGIAWYSASTSTGLRGTSKKGLGTTAGIGYSIPISSGTRISFEIDGQAKSADGDKVRSLLGTIGFMW